MRRTAYRQWATDHEQVEIHPDPRVFHEPVGFKRICLKVGEQEKRDQEDNHRRNEQYESPYCPNPTKNCFENFHMMNEDSNYCNDQSIGSIPFLTR